MMKHMTVFATTIILIFITIGCSMHRGMINTIQEERIIEGIDLTRYSEKGFLITPGDYGADYESIGIFSFTIYPPANRIEKEIKVTKTDSTGNKVEEIVKTYQWVQEDCDIQKAFDFIYQEALARKADGIINLKIETINKAFSDGDFTEWISGTKVHGFLIRRVRK